MRELNDEELEAVSGGFSKVVLGPLSGTTFDSVSADIYVRNQMKVLSELKVRELIDPLNMGS